MPKFCANLTMLFNEVDFMDRFEKAAKAGFKGVEYLFPYAYPKEQLAEKLGAYGLVQALHNLPAGDWAKGERGIACLPGREGEFQDGVGKAIAYAKALKCPLLNCLVGLTPAGVPADKVRQTLVANLRFAAAALEKEGIRLLVETLNDKDVPGFYLRAHGGRARPHQRGRQRERLLPVRRLPHADHGGEPDENHSGEPRADRPHPDRRQPGQERARHRRDQLPLSLQGHRRRRLHGLDRLRVQAGRENRGRPRLDQGGLRLRLQVLSGVRPFCKGAQDPCRP